MNVSQKKEGKGSPNMHTKGPIKYNQPLVNLSKSKTKKGKAKTKKDTGKWYDFHKIPWHNIDECCINQSLVVDLKASELDLYFDSNSNIGEGKNIIDVEPSATISTTQIHVEDLEESKEGERLFHLQIWVKGTLLNFIVDNGSQKNLISA